MDYLSEVSSERLRRDLFCLCRDPFSFRTVMYTIPWHDRNSLDEFDDFLVEELKQYAGDVVKYPYKVRPFRCDSSKPLHHWYSSPREDDPWYDANSILVTLPGSGPQSDEIIQLVSHKDSMSWINSPGAHDNAVGTVANMELVRILSKIKLNRTVRVLFCNEEHSPWHSLDMAKLAKSKDDKIIAVLNQDSLCGKSDEDAATGKKTFACVYSTPEGKQLAMAIAELAKELALPLDIIVADKGKVNDDDGSFIKAGFLTTVMNLGSFPYKDSQYHLPGDIPERVDIENLKLSTQLILAMILKIDKEGFQPMKD